MKYIILTMFLAVFKESYSLKPEIRKYDSFMKDFEATGRQLKQEKNKEMNSLIVKREDQNIDTTVSQPTKNGKETLLHRGSAEENNIDKIANETHDWIQTLPKPQRTGALQAHGRWYGMAKGRETKLEDKLNLMAIPMQALQVRDAIERRINWMYGETKPAEKSYMAALEDALTSNEKSITSNFRIMEFRLMIEGAGFEDMESFVTVMKVLYKDFSFGQAHKITGSNTKLPSHEDVGRISKILEAAGAPLVSPNIKALQAFLKPCKEMRLRAPGEDLRCLIFKATHPRHAKQFKPEAKISKEDIFHAFPEIKPLRAAWVSYADKKQEEVKEVRVYMIQVEFETARNASNGFHNNHGWFKKFKVRPEQSPCYDEFSADVVIEEIASPGDTVTDPGQVVTPSLTKMVQPTPSIEI